MKARSTTTCYDDVAVTDAPTGMTSLIAAAVAAAAVVMAAMPTSSRHCTAPHAPAPHGRQREGNQCRPARAQRCLAGWTRRINSKQPKRAMQLAGQAKHRTVSSGAWTESTQLLTHLSRKLATHTQTSRIQSSSHVLTPARKLPLVVTVQRYDLLECSFNLQHYVSVFVIWAAVNWKLRLGNVLHGQLIRIIRRYLTDHHLLKGTPVLQQLQLVCA